MQLVEIKNLSAGYNEFPVLKNFNLSVKLGEFISLIGPNGAGKTTLLHALMGLNPTISGTRIINSLINPSPQQLSSFVGYVPQKLNIDKTIPVTVAEFLDLKHNNQLSDTQRKEIYTSLEITHLLPRCLARLSTGEQQRVYLAFALLGRPKLILLDESLEGVDIGIQNSIYTFLQRKTVELKEASVILISHDVSAVSQWATRVVCFGHGHLYDGAPSSPDFHTCLHKIYGEKSLIHDHLH